MRSLLDSSQGRLQDSYYQEMARQKLKVVTTVQSFFLLAIIYFFLLGKISESGAQRCQGDNRTP